MFAIPIMRLSNLSVSSMAPCFGPRVIGGVQPPSAKQRKYVVDEAVKLFLCGYKVNRRIR